MPRFKVPCPSCENQVLIKNPNLIGTKVECTKCKYRFKVEAPADAAGGAPAAEAEAGEKSKKAGKKNTKYIVGAVLAVAVLGGVGFVMFSGGSGDNKKKGGGYAGGGGGGGKGNTNDQKQDDKGKGKGKDGK